MKTLLFLLIPMAVFGQPPVKSNAIKVSGVGFMEACNKLLDLGYGIEKKDNELQTASTEWKEYKTAWNAEYTIRIRVTDSVLTITGFVTAPPKTGELIKDNRLSHEKPKKHMYTVGFAYLDAYAKSFSKPVEYLKQ